MQSKDVQTDAVPLLQPDVSKFSIGEKKLFDETDADQVPGKIQERPLIHVEVYPY